MNWDLIGHEWAVQLLQRHVATGQERQAYLFAGPPGVGRRTLALRFAQALNCPQPIAPGEPCRVCRTCQQIERMQHPDLAVVQAEQQAGILKVDQIRALQHSLSLAPFEARYRIALLLNFQNANDSAANALLKTLEEAPSRAILLLTADSVEGLLPTITSRCETLRLRPLSLDRLSEVLQQHGMGTAEARLLAHRSGGRLGTALNWMSDPAALEQREVWLNELEELIAASLRERFSYAARIAKEKETLRQAMETWLSYWRDILLCASGADTPLVNLDRETRLRWVGDQVGLAQARQVVSRLEIGLAQLDANLNTRLLAEVILMDWPRLVYCGETV